MAVIMTGGTMVTRNARRAAAMSLCSALLAVAACAPVKGPSGAAAPPPPARGPAGPATPRPEAVHRVAVLVPLSGANAAVGQSLANAATLALSDSGRTGIRITSYDTAALGAAAAAQRAMAEGAELVLGPLLAADIDGVRAATAGRKVTVLSFSNDAALAGGNVYVLGFQPGQSVSRVVAYSASRGIRRFAGLIPNGLYGQRAAVAFTRAVESSGGQIVAMTSFARDRAAMPAAARQVTNYDERLRKAGAAARRPDGTIAPVASALGPVAFQALLVADSGVIAGGFAPLLARYGATPGSYLMLGTELWNTEPNLKTLPALRGAIFASVPDDRFRAMADRYRARFGSTPSRLASLSYDAMLLAASADASGWKLAEPFPGAMLADPKGFAGIDGIFRFEANVAVRGLQVQQIGAAGFTTLSPAPRSFD